DKMVLGSGVGGDGEWCRTVLVSGGVRKRRKTGCLILAGSTVHCTVFQRTMDMTIDQQVALDKALVPHASRLRIGKRNFHLRLDITSKESTIQLATVTVHHHSIRFKMNNKKCIVNLEYFREMMHICPRLPGKTFDDFPFEEEILAFLRFLRHSGETRKLTNAQILWGMYHKKNVDFTYLLWEDFVYQVEHKDAKKSNEMYYPRFIKVIIHYFMTKDPSNPRRNKVNLHYVRDDQMFTMIKLCYAVALGAAPPKTKASVRKTKSNSNTTITPPTAAGTRLSTSAKGKQPAKASKAKSLTVLSEQQKKPPNLDRDWNKTLPVTHESIQLWISDLAKQADSRSSFNELMHTPVDFSAFLMNRLKVDTLTSEFLAGPTYKLMKGSCKSLVELEFFLEEPLPLIPTPEVVALSHLITSLTMTSSIYVAVPPVVIDRESARDVYFKRRIIVVIDLKIVKWHNYKHMDWITNVHKKHRNPTACGRSLTSDGTLNDVRTALDDHLKGIRMKYLPQTIWRKSDKERAAAMI
nr:hypothetical protein [Tanacetum cinerariifolium]